MRYITGGFYAVAVGQHQLRIKPCFQRLIDGGHSDGFPLVCPESNTEAWREMGLLAVQNRRHHPAGGNVYIPNRNGKAQILQLDHNLNLTCRQLFHIRMGRAGGAQPRVGKTGQKPLFSTNQMAERLGWSVRRADGDPRDVDWFMIPAPARLAAWGNKQILMGGGVRF
ncbi:hypothetical protein D3C71_1179140 [compost metagenome]